LGVYEQEVPRKRSGIFECHWSLGSWGNRLRVVQSLESALWALRAQLPLHRLEN
jgi:hypothetical protein